VAPHVVPPAQLPEQDDGTGIEQLVLATTLVCTIVSALLSVRENIPIPTTNARPVIINNFFIVIHFKSYEELKRLKNKKLL